MTASWLYAGRIGWRRRWRGLLVLGLLVGLAAGAVTAAAAASRRTASAYDRLADATLRYDVAIQDDGEGAPVVDQVADAGLPNAVAHDRVTVVIGLVDEEELVVTGGSTGDFGYRMDRPVLVDGRLPGADATDEILLNQGAAETFDKAVGDRIEIATLTPEEFDGAIFGPGLEAPPTGPVLDLEVVGIGKIPDDLDQPDAAAIVSPALIEETQGQVGSFDNLARVRFEDPDQIAAGIDALEELPGYEGELVYVTRGQTDGERVRDAVAVEALSMVALAVAAGVALLFVVALVLGRQVLSSPSDQRSLAACGLVRRSRALVLAGPYVPVAVVAAVTALVSAVALSAAFPIGVAGQAEPNRGVDLDLTVLLAGSMIIGAVILVATGLTAWRSSSRAMPSNLPRGHRKVRPSVGDTVARNTPFGPSASMGIRLALEPGAGDRAVPARSALLSVCIGLAGLAAVLVFAASLDRLLDSPNLYGFSWDAIVSAGEDQAETHQIETQLDDDDRVAAFSYGDMRQVEIEGEDVGVASLESRKGDLRPVLLSGREPLAVDEIALGPLDQRDVGASEGDTIDLPGADGPVSATVVGTVLVPVGDDNDESGRGALMTPAGLDRLAVSDGSRGFLVAFAPGTDEEAFVRDFPAQTELAEPPISVDNLRRAQGVPRLLAAFLVVLGIAGLAHALAVTARRRREDLWTLRALGLRRRQLRSLAGWHALTIAVFGLAVGIPVGVAAGRAVWRELADRLGVVGDPAAAWTVLAESALGAIVVLVIIGVVASWLAARLVVTRPVRHE